MKNKVIHMVLASLVLLSLPVAAGPQEEKAAREIGEKIALQAIETYGKTRDTYDRIGDLVKKDEKLKSLLTKLGTFDQERRKLGQEHCYITFIKQGIPITVTDVAGALGFATFKDGEEVYFSEMNIDTLKVFMKHCENLDAPYYCGKNKQTTIATELQKKILEMPKDDPEAKEELQFFTQAKQMLEEQIQQNNQPPVLNNSNFVWKVLGGAAAATGLVWLGYACYKKFKEWKAKKKNNNLNALGS